MNTFRTKKYILFLCIAILVGALSTYFYFFLPTRIAWVNFRDEDMAEIRQANDNWFIQSKQISVKTNDFSSLLDYPVIYLFHISSLTDEQRDGLQKAMQRGAKVHVFVPTSKENNFSNITGNDMTYIKNYFENKSKENIKKLLNYSRKVFDNKSLFVEDIQPADTFPKDVFYRIGTELYHTDVQDYWSYYKEEQLYQEARPVIAILNALATPQLQFRSYQDRMILELERRGFNVVAVAGFQKRLANLQATKPEMVIYFPHGRLDMQASEETIQWLNKSNVLLLMPQLLQQPYDEWMADQQGLSGGMLGQNIVVPELDGAIYPYAVAASYKNKEGLYTYQPIPGRVERFCETASRWLSLREKPNFEKKLAIYYYKGAGKNAMVAGGLEVGESLYRLLHRLKEEGYQVKDLPDSLSDFMHRIHTEGPILGTYAKGSFEEFLATGRPSLISEQRYEKWCQTELSPKSYQEVIQAYGPAPGTYMTTTREDTTYLAIPRVLFGNVSLLPVLPAALDENEFKLVHGAKQAPPHAYLASYLWARMQFRADVVAHFGAHGSLEFTPWKQVLLSIEDWPEALIAPLPHLYLYSVDNIGEAMMAKRRTYATMISHLTPPQAAAELHGGLKLLSLLLHNYSSTSRPDLKASYKLSIRSSIDTLGISKDLDLPQQEIDSLGDESVQLLHNYVHHLEREKITTGLHTLGKSFTAEELDETVKMISLDPLSSTLKEIALLRSPLPRPSHHRGHTHRRQVVQHHAVDDYEAMATQMIEGILEDSSDPLSYMSRSDQRLLAELERMHPDIGGTEDGMLYDQKSHRMVKPSAPSGAAAEGEMVYDQKSHRMVKPSVPSGAAAEGEMVYDQKSHRMMKPSASFSQLDEPSAQGLALQLAAHRETAQAMDQLHVGEYFEEMSSLLDETSLRKLENAASMAPELREKVTIARHKKFTELLHYMQDSSHRLSLLAWLRSPEIRARVEAYTQQMDQRTLQQASAEDFVEEVLWVCRVSESDFQKKLASWEKPRLRSLSSRLAFYIKAGPVIEEATIEKKSDLRAIQALLKSEEAFLQIKSRATLVERALSQKVGQEKQLLSALRQLKASLLSVPVYKKHLMMSPQLELAAFVRAMSGGFVEPSSGGDPISNPLSIPTARNLYSINAEMTPTKEAYALGQQLAQEVLKKHLARHGKYPQKVAYTLWGGEFVRNQGLDMGQIFYMLGVEPLRNQRGRVYDVGLMSMDKLKRPRIDVLVQTSGQFRDLAASRIHLINKAVALAAQAEDSNEYPNHVQIGTLVAEKRLKEQGLSALEARRLSTVRVFGGVNGHYGTGIMEQVERGDSWERDQEIATRYIQNMGAIYAEGNWSAYREGMFETMLQNTEIVIHPRSSNVSGPISLDHVYEFMGGLTASVRVSTSRNPDGYFSDYRDRFKPRIQGLREAIWTETRTHLFNPKFIRAQMKEGETAAEEFAENFRNTYGWNVMNPSAIDTKIWEGYYDIYVQDKLKLGIRDFFEATNPYALQEMTAVMLETIRKGYWKPAESTTKEIISLHAELVGAHRAACSRFVCDNAKLQEMIEKKLTGELKKSYIQGISEVKNLQSSSANTREGMLLKKEETISSQLQEVWERNSRSPLGLLLLLGVIVTALLWGLIRKRRAS